MQIKKLIKKSRLLNWIYIFQKLYKNKKPNLHFGEFAEDIFINRVFQKFQTGFYVDIGAYHPFKGSLTYLLHKKGWRGMNIDLSEQSIKLFKIARPKDFNINCAISNFNGETYYYQNSEINQQNSLLKTSEKQKKIKVNSFTLDKLINEKKISKIDFLNIDTEGNEYDIVKSIDFKLINPLLISVESNCFDSNNANKNNIIIHLKKNHYELINTIGVTMFFFKKEDIDNIFDLINIR